MQTEYSKRRAELEHKNIESFCLEFLNSPLVVDTDYEVENEGDPIAYKTEDGTFYFVPQLDDPVMGGRTLNGQHPIPGRYRYSVEVCMTYGGSYWEPPDYDMSEIGREDSLIKAIGCAARYLLDNVMEDKLSSDFWMMESELGEEFPEMITF